MSSPTSSRRGSALMSALILTMLASIGVAALLRYSSQSNRMTRRALDYQRARVVAEAGLDYGVRELQKLVLRYQFSQNKEQMQSLVNLLPAPPSLDGYEYTTPSGEVAFKITVENDPTDGVIPEGNVARGEFGQYQRFTITSGARNPESGVGVVLSQNIQATSVFIMRFGVFYWYDLEINPGRTMYFDGPIHTNHDVYMTGPLEIRAPVTAHGAFYHDRKDSRSPSLGSTTIHNEHGDQVNLMQGGRAVDSTSSTWMTDALNFFHGNAQSSNHGVPLLTPPINPLDEPYEIIRRPLPADDPEYRVETENEKFANKAALRIHVQSDGSLVATDFFGVDVTSRFSKAVLERDGERNGRPLYEKDSDGSYDMDDEGSYDVDQRFLDQRENVTVAPVDIYVDELVEEFPELFSGTTYGVEEGRGVLYVTRDPVEDETGVMPAVRVRNGASVPTGGITVATDLPLYLEGNFNIGDEDARQPSMMTADAVTFLSNSWQDARSTERINNRQASDTNYNTVVMTGNTETVLDGQYNGGLENVLRFMENWSNRRVTFRGSIIDIWYSQIADSDWSYGQYYTAPRRDWEFDPILRNQAPPGVTRVFGVEMLTWRVDSWEEHGWN